MRVLIEYRFVFSLACSAVAGVVGLHTWPFPADNVFLVLIQVHEPTIYAGFSYTYATVWFSTPFLLISGVCSFLYIFVARWDRPTTSQPPPPYPAPETRKDLFLILGERHRQTSPQPASTPTWLTIPERGLYTGMVIVGAIGTGKTSACMYPYVDQLLGYRASDPTHKLGGLILEVKGDFCTHVRDLLARHGRAHVPFVLFLDVAMPPQDRETRPSWFADVAASVDQVVAKHRPGRNPFDWVSRRKSMSRVVRYG